MEITTKDRELLGLLQANARLPIVNLAKKLSMSRTTVQSRLDRLERIGVIEGYGVRLSEGYAASLIRACVLITIAPKSLAQVTASFRGIQAVSTLHTVSGAFDLIALISVPSITELDQLINEIGEIEGVQKTQSSIILSTRISR